MFIRLTTLLCASLYGSMVILGTQQPGTATTAVAEIPQTDPVSARSAFSPSTSSLAINASYTTDTPIVLPVPTIKTEDVATTAAAITPDPKPKNDSGLLSIGSFDAPAEVLQDKGIDVVKVTGNVVNLRGGPSTNTDVVGKLHLGARAELMDEVDGGWMKIRDLDSGTEGFMSADFLERVTPS